MGTTKSKAPDYGRFAVAQEAIQKNILWSSMGPGGSGKTHFGLTAPAPIAVMLFDPAGLKGLMQNPLFKTKDIRVIPYEFNPGVMKDKSDRGKAAMEELAKFEEDWKTALGFARTVLWDKEDHVWELLRYANNEDFQAEPKSYYELNMQYRGWFTEAEACGLNFGVIRGIKEKWGKTGVNNRTGRPTYGGLGIDIARGQKEVEELVQINLEHSWEDEERVFKTRIRDKCRLGEDVKKLLGETYEDLDFLTLAMELFPDSDVSDWE